MQKISNKLTSARNVTFRHNRSCRAAAGGNTRLGFYLVCPSEREPGDGLEISLKIHHHAVRVATTRGFRRHQQHVMKPGASSAASCSQKYSKNHVCCQQSFCPSHRGSREVLIQPSHENLHSRVLAASCSSAASSSGAFFTLACDHFLLSPRINRTGICSFPGVLATWSL